MLRLLLLLTLGISLVGCGLGPSASELKSPCVSVSKPGEAPAPCVKRSANAHWLG